MHTSFRAGVALHLTVPDPTLSKMSCQPRLRKLSEVPRRTEGDKGNHKGRTRHKKGLGNNEWF